MDSMMEEVHEVSKESPFLTPKALTITGKMLGISLAVSASVIHIFFTFEFDMDAINKMAWTLALLGAPIDISMIVKNFK